MSKLVSVALATISLAAATQSAEASNARRRRAAYPATVARSSKASGARYAAEQRKLKARTPAQFRQLRSTLRALHQHLSPKGRKAIGRLLFRASQKNVHLAKTIDGVLVVANPDGTVTMHQPSKGRSGTEYTGTRPIVIGRMSADSKHEDASRTRRPVVIRSFGFKYEAGLRFDLQFDLRTQIRNPQSHLPAGAIGLHSEVKAAVLGSTKNRKLFQNYYARVKKALKSGEGMLSIGFGCRSGIHRSVVFAEELASRLKKDGFDVEVEHVDLNIP